MVSRKLNSGSTSSSNPIPSDITRYHLILTEPHLYTAYSVIEIICSHDFTTSYGHTRPMSLLDGGQLWTGDHNIHLFIGRANQSIIGLNYCKDIIMPNFSVLIMLNFLYCFFFPSQLFHVTLSD